MSAAVNYNLFQEKIESISSKQTKDIVSSRELDNYQLVDVRQPNLLQRISE